MVCSSRSQCTAWSFKASKRSRRAWHLAQWRRNSSQRCCLATYSLRCCCCCAATWLARSISGSIGPGPSPARMEVISMQRTV